MRLGGIVTNIHRKLPWLCYGQELRPKKYAKKIKIGMLVGYIDAIFLGRRR